MIVNVNEDFVQSAHEAVNAEAITFFGKVEIPDSNVQPGMERGDGARFLKMCGRYVEGHWKRFIPKIELFSRPLKDGVFLDFGCKFGHLTPLLMDQQVAKIYAVDVADEHLRDGERFFGSRFPVTFIKSENCRMDIESNSIDFVLVNEVISHINPAFLDTFYSEVARVLKPGGELVISDGNNWAHLKTRVDLLEWYTLWEKGTSKEFGDANYTKMRKMLIAKSFPELDEKALDYLAENTSGLWGQQIDEAVQQYLSGAGFMPRPHRAGMCPTHPAIGVVMERAFDPRQVIISLETCGLEAVQLLRGHPLHDDTRRGSTKNFTVRAVKLPETEEALIEFAHRALKPAPSV